MEHSIKIAKQALYAQPSIVYFEQVWPHDNFPLKEIGTLTLTGNPSNYFAQVEQAAFSPSRLVPGIESSPDQLLQGRIFAYNDTQMHRLGVNYNQLPVNRPKESLYPPHNYERDGPQSIIVPGKLLCFTVVHGALCND